MGHTAVPAWTQVPLRLLPPGTAARVPGRHAGFLLCSKAHDSIVNLPQIPIESTTCAPLPSGTLLALAPPLVTSQGAPNAVHNTMDAVSQTVAALRQYLFAHPQACDTVAGIAAWWPLPRSAGTSPDVVGAALAVLVACGEMECAFGPDGQTVYRAVRPAGRGGLQLEPQGS